MNSLWDYNPEPSDPLHKLAKILVRTNFSNHTTTQDEFEFSKVYLLDKDTGGANFIYFVDVGKS